MATRMQQRRGTAATWTSANPILAAGEIGFETDTNKFKIGDGSNRWANLAYFVDGNSIIDGAPGLLNTLNELAAAVNDDPNFFATVATNLSNHEADTTNVHGIADTAELATKTFAAELLTNATKSNITITGNKNGLTITAENGVADSDTDDLVEGTTNKYFTNQRALDATAAAYDAAGSASTAQSNAETFTTNAINALDTDDIEEGSSNKYFTDERAQDAIGNALGTGLSYDDNTGSISVTANTYDSYGSASAVSSNLDGHALQTVTHGVTGNIVGTTDSQTLSNKTISYVDNTITLELSNIADVTATYVELNLLDGATATTSEINHLSGVTSGIQGQLDEKANLDGASFTGAITSDSSISTTDTTSSTSASTGSIVTAGGLGVGGDSYIGGDLTISGNFTVNGTTTTVSTQDLVVQDPIIYIGEGNSANSVDLGLVASFDDGAYQHTGLARDASAGTWKLFKGVTDEPGATINFTQGSLDDLAVGGLTANSLTVGDISNTEIGYLNGVTSSIQTQIDGKISSSSSDTLTNKTISYTDNTITVQVANVSDLTATAAELNTLDGIVASTAELNTLYGITASTAELNVLDGVTASTSELNVLDGITVSTIELNVLDGITASTSELNVLDGITASTTELNYVDGVTSSVQSQLDSKATHVSPTFTGTVVLPSTTSIGDVSSTEISYLDGVTSGIQSQINEKAPLNSPGLTGTPTAPTAALGTNTTQVATTAFVDAAILDIVNRNLILDGGGV